MKIVIDQSGDYGGIEIIVKCKTYNDEVAAILDRIKTNENRILAFIADKTFVIDTGEILYFESVDKKCFVYTENQVYETAFRLYELEHMLSTKGFFRATKSSIVNIAKIKSIQSSFNSVLTLEMENGENLHVSRQYAPILKERLGM